MRNSYCSGTWVKYVSDFVETGFMIRGLGKNLEGAV